jgi:hypothetical protein
LQLAYNWKSTKPERLRHFSTCNWFTTGEGIKLHLRNLVKLRANLFLARRRACPEKGRQISQPISIPAQISREGGRDLR